MKNHAAPAACMRSARPRRSSPRSEPDVGAPESPPCAATTPVGFPFLNPTYGEGGGASMRSARPRRSGARSEPDVGAPRAHRVQQQPPSGFRSSTRPSMTSPRLSRLFAFHPGTVISSWFASHRSSRSLVRGLNVSPPSIRWFLTNRILHARCAQGDLDWSKPHLLGSVASPGDQVG